MEMEIEGLKLKGITIKDLLVQEFINNLKKAGIDANAVSLIFVREDVVGEKKNISPFVLSHQNSKEIDEKIIHISGSNEGDLKKFSDVLKKIKK